MRFKPHDYQKKAIEFMIKNPKCGLFLDMGLGKTVITLTGIKLLRDEYFDINKVLIIAPKTVAEASWNAENIKWDHLKDLKVLSVAGTPNQRKKLLEEEADVYTISRDNVAWLVDYLKTDWQFDTLVIDELSSFKNNQSKRFKKLRTITPFLNRVIGLTGTPAPNGYLDLWAQIYLLDRGERLEKNITKYRNKYFNGYSRGMYTDYQIKEGAKALIDKNISDICMSMTAKDYLKTLKDPIFIDIKVRLSAKELETYKSMAKDAILELEDKEIAALSAAVVTNKLLQIANGAVYDSEKNYHEIHARKLDALEELIEQAGNENVLVFYNFQSDLERIKNKFPEAVKFEGEAELIKWNKGEIKILLAHPASAGHGLNLQEGGSIIVWYGLTWSLEHYLQANARLHRQGQKNVVRIYRLISAGTVDERVLDVINGKKITQDELLKKLKMELE